MIDLHSHILPGIDDGARTIEDAIEIARAAIADGVEIIAATPHVRDDHPTSAEQMEDGVAELRLAIARAGLSLDVLRTARFRSIGSPGWLPTSWSGSGWPRTPTICSSSAPTTAGRSSSRSNWPR